MLLCGMLWTLLDALVLAGILTRPVKGIPSTAWKKHEDTNLSKAQKRCVCYILRHRKVRAAFPWPSRHEPPSILPSSGEHGLSPCAVQTKPAVSSAH